MGQAAGGSQLGCCSAREAETITGSPNAKQYQQHPQVDASGRSAAEVRELKEHMLNLQRMVGDMQGNLQQLQNDNLMLQEQNRGLEGRNKALMESLAEQDCAQSWSQFDIVEEHYRQIAKHSAEEQNDVFVQGEGDLSAGVSPRIAKAASATQERKESKADLDITISIVDRDDLRNISTTIVDAVAAEGWTREEIMGIKPEAFKDSAGATIEAANPEELVNCEHWPLTLRFTVSVKRAESPLWVEREPKEPKAPRAFTAPRDDTGRRSTGSVPSPQRPPVTYRLDDEADETGNPHG